MIRRPPRSTLFPYTSSSDLAMDQQAVFAHHLLTQLSGPLGGVLVTGLREADQSKEAGIKAQRQRVAELKGKLAGIDSAEARALLAVDRKSTRLNSITATSRMPSSA